jgi:hypothetical protein
MRYIHNLAVDEPTLPKCEYEELCRRRPDGRKPTGFRLTVISETKIGNEFIQFALGVLNAHGVTRAMHSNACCYGYYVQRIYETVDLANAELLHLKSQRQIQNLSEPERDEQGRLLLSFGNAKSSVKMASIFPNWIIISEEVRRMFESGGLIGLRFREVAIVGKSRQTPIESFWELQSSIPLPKMANTHQFIHRGLTQPEPFAGDYSRAVLISDIPFFAGEIHYHRSDLNAFNPFDIGYTFENYIERHSALVVSQRFYQYCLKNKIPLAVEPVRIDPE